MPGAGGGGLPLPRLGGGASLRGPRRPLTPETVTPAFPPTHWGIITATGAPIGPGAGCRPSSLHPHPPPTSGWVGGGTQSGTSPSKESGHAYGPRRGPGGGFPCRSCTTSAGTARTRPSTSTSSPATRPPPLPLPPRVPLGSSLAVQREAGPPTQGREGGPAYPWRSISRPGSGCWLPPPLLPRTTTESLLADSQPAAGLEPSLPSSEDGVSSASRKALAGGHGERGRGGGTVRL